MATHNVSAQAVEGKAWEQEKERLLAKYTAAMDQVLGQLELWKHTAEVAEVDKLVHKHRSKALAMRLSRAEVLLKREKGTRHG